MNQLTLQPRPLAGVIGEDLYFYCSGTPADAADIVLREGGEAVKDSGRLNERMINNTHKQYSLRQLRGRDIGREFVCGLAEFNSPPVVIQLACKLLHTYYG